MAKLKLIFDLLDTQQALIDLLQPVTTTSKKTLLNYIAGIENGSYQMNNPEKGWIGSVSATGTITLSAMIATDTITVNGTVFTCMASGASGNQFNVGLSDTATATNAAAAINASATASVTNNVVATSSGAVITITSVDPGTVGNNIPIAISAHGSVSGGGKLASGTDGTAYNMAL